jgi:hypothetical protein
MLYLLEEGHPKNVQDVQSSQKKEVQMYNPCNYYLHFVVLVLHLSLGYQFELYKINYITQKLYQNKI